MVTPRSRNKWYKVKIENIPQVTASTVGYGDICVRTSLGKLAVILYLLVAIASFANFVPEIVELLGNRPKYAGTYEVGQLVNTHSSFLFVSFIFPTTFF